MCYSLLLDTTHKSRCKLPSTIRLIAFDPSQSVEVAANV
jgi:hypothetical protein